MGVGDGPGRGLESPGRPAPTSPSRPLTAPAASFLDSGTRDRVAGRVRPGEQSSPAGHSSREGPDIYSGFTSAEGLHRRSARGDDSSRTCRVRCGGGSTEDPELFRRRGEPRGWSPCPRGTADESGPSGRTAEVGYPRRYVGRLRLNFEQVKEGLGEWGRSPDQPDTG